MYAWECLYLENFTRRRVYCCYKWKIFEKNIILVLKLIVDYKHQDYKHQGYRNSRPSGKKLPLEQKILTKEMANTEVYCP
jgi:hypothetical protein